jgi:hypothetical protein
LIKKFGRKEEPKGIYKIMPLCVLMVRCIELLPSRIIEAKIIDPQGFDVDQQNDITNTWTSFH